MKYGIKVPKKKKQPMRYYAGLDVSMKETFVCIVDEKGKKYYETSVSTDPSSIANLIYGLDVPIELAGIESGSLSHWLTEELQRLDVSAICIDARHIAAILSVNINKTDKNDARGIADAMRCSLYKEVSVKSKDHIAMCTLLNSRRLLVDQRVQLTGTIRGLLKPYGIRLGALSKGVAAIKTIKEKLTGIPPVAAKSIKQLLCVLEGLLETIKNFDREIAVQTKECPQEQILMEEHMLIES